jgi:organic radical activating enzyme
MNIKSITDEDFINYKTPSMFIITSICSFKCDKESGESMCQNSSLAFQKTINIKNSNIIERYLNNPITKAIVFGGLEPFDQYEELFDFISELRHSYGNKDTVVIYTGYNKDEIDGYIRMLMLFPNIIIKFGRFIPNQKPHFDNILGINLASDNQYAEVIS